MNNLPSLFTPSRTRSEPAAPSPTPERRVADANGTDFARSLASVRGLERSAAMQDRAASMRTAVRTDGVRTDRGETRTDNDATTLVRTRSQVQALMLSGAMKFAATRAADSSSTGTPALAAGTVATPALNAVPVIEEIATDVAALMPSIVPATSAVPNTVLLQSETIVETDQLPAMTVTPGRGPTPPVALDEATFVSAASSSETVSPELSASAAATAAAMHLVATLPLPDAPTVVDETQPEATPSGTGTDDDAARAAWTNRLASQQTNADATTLVEDHFDAPAYATHTPQQPATVPSTPALRDVLPANVTITVADAAMTPATAPATAPATTPATTPAATTPRPTTDAAPDVATIALAPSPAGAVTVRRDVQAVERDLAPLAPEFRERLQRVMDRMQQEFGHEVTVVETVRSTARQAALFAQGRTAPGPVVTWTRNSKHSKGLAADLMVDGQWDNPAGYTHLAEIAKQEGLRTLGARDPGHVELPADGSVSAETLGTLLGDLAGDAGDTARKVRAEVDVNGRENNASTMARVADVAQVARVSQVAQVARVASVARPGAAPSRGEQGSAEPISPLATSGPLPQFMMDATAGARLAAPVSNVNMADRISHLMDLQASQSAKPLNSVLLRMDNANGIEDQIRIDTRGTSVDAQLGLGSAQQAAELSGRVNELREALERRGLTADGVRVQAAPRATDSVNFTRTTAPAIDIAAMRAGADAQAQGGTRDQAARDQQQREAQAREQERPTPRSSSDDARHRSRREQPETRQ